uniref:Glycosyltransferase family 28 N-terminal domain-containing protein n=1 Tax=Alexandrium monilatum TaxID=311494 RepID=A0A7S4URA9_9DINO
MSKAPPPLYCPSLAGWALQHPPAEARSVRLRRPGAMPANKVAKPNTWEVVGGSRSGGLVVRKGSDTKSAEFPERLATGSVIQEIELQGERMRYTRVTGSGPDEGWIGTKFKGKDQLKKRPLKVWFLATGTRGDIQPYLALACGMQEAGYDVSIWTCEDYKRFVESYGIRMFNIAGSVEELIKSMSKGKPLNKNENMDKAQEGSQPYVAFTKTWARWSLSIESGKPVGGIDASKLLPEEVQEAINDKGVCRQLYLECSQQLQRIGSNELSNEYWKVFERLHKEIEEEEEEERKKKEAEESSTPDVESLDWDALRSQAQSEEWSSLGKVIEVAEELGEEGSGVLKCYLGARRYWQEERAANTIPDAGRFGLDAIFLKDLIDDSSLLKNMKDQVERNPPDVCLYNYFWLTVAVMVEHVSNIPTVHLTLQPAGINFGDHHALWVTQDIYPMLQQLNPSLQQFSTLEEARQNYWVPEESTDYAYWAVGCVYEDLITAPVFGAHPLRDAGPAVTTRRQRERHMVGFLRSIASERFMKFMGEFSQKAVAKLTYTGFWIMPEKHQTSDSSAEMFGGAELMKTVEDFIAAGDPPAYIGWGSCVGSRGRHWMIALAVASLMKAQMRGIILSGWAELNMELLQDLVGDDDGIGLVEYAKKNILFITKAPQVWLFPKCSVVVIHGGVGTLAAAWTSGTPLIICAVWLDQFTNSWLNTLMGTGVSCQAVDMCTATELAQCLTTARTTPEVRRGAQAVQFSMMRDNGIQTALEHIGRIMLEDVPTGKWKQWFL